MEQGESPSPSVAIDADRLNYDTIDPRSKVCAFTCDGRSCRRDFSRLTKKKSSAILPSSLFSFSLFELQQASAVASEVATAAQEQASKAAAVAAEQAAKVQSTDAFAFASTTFAEIRANTIAAAGKRGRGETRQKNKHNHHHVRSVNLTR